MTNDSDIVEQIKGNYHEAAVYLRTVVGKPCPYDGLDQSNRFSDEEIKTVATWLGITYGVPNRLSDHTSLITDIRREDFQFEINKYCPNKGYDKSSLLFIHDSALIFTENMESQYKVYLAEPGLPKYKKTKVDFLIGHFKKNPLSTDTIEIVYSVSRLNFLDECTEATLYMGWVIDMLEKGQKLDLPKFKRKLGKKRNK